MAAPRRPAVSASSSSSSTMLKRPAPALSRPSSRQPLSATSPNAVIQTNNGGARSSSVKPLMKSRSVSSSAALPSIHSRTSSSASVASSKNNNNNGNQASSNSLDQAGNEASIHSNGRNESEASQGNIKVVVRCRQVEVLCLHVTSIAILTAVLVWDSQRRQCSRTRRIIRSMHHNIRDPGPRSLSNPARPAPSPSNSTSTTTFKYRVLES